MTYRITFSSTMRTSLNCSVYEIKYSFYGILHGLDWYTRSCVLEEPVAFTFRIVKKEATLFQLRCE
jgi:hypothetical protein